MEQQLIALAQVNTVLIYALFTMFGGVGAFAFILGTRVN